MRPRTIRSWLVKSYRARVASVAGFLEIGFDLAAVNAGQQRVDFVLGKQIGVGHE